MRWKWAGTLPDMSRQQHTLTGVTGGETVVTLPAEHGLGGRSQALALSFMLDMQDAGFDWVYLLLVLMGATGRQMRPAGW